jgi:hypothetical protein
MTTYKFAFSDNLFGRIRQKDKAVMGIKSNEDDNLTLHFALVEDELDDLEDFLDDLSVTSTDSVSDVIDSNIDTCTEKSASSDDGLIAIFNEFLTGEMGKRLTALKKTLREPAEEKLENSDAEMESDSNQDGIPVLPEATAQLHQPSLEKLSAPRRPASPLRHNPERTKG